MSKMDFRHWLEIKDKEDSLPPAPLEDEDIPWEVWNQWEEPLQLFVYGNLMREEKRPLGDFQPARIRGMIRVFDAPEPDGRTAMVSIRKTGRLEDTVNGGIINIPGEDVKTLAKDFPGFSLGKASAIKIDPETGKALKKVIRAHFLFHPSRAAKKLQPNPEALRKLLKAAFDISPEFGHEFMRTTFRLPKRGSRLIRITR